MDQISNRMQREEDKFRAQSFYPHITASMAKKVCDYPGKIDDLCEKFQVYMVHGTSDIVGQNTFFYTREQAVAYFEEVRALDLVLLFFEKNELVRFKVEMNHYH